MGHDHALEAFDLRGKELLTNDEVRKAYLGED
jgi:hypothetical protein